MVVLAQDISLPDFLAVSGTVSSFVTRIHTFLTGLTLGRLGLIYINKKVSLRLVSYQLIPNISCNPSI